MKRALIQIGVLTVLFATIGSVVHLTNSHHKHKETPIWANPMGTGTAADYRKAAYPFGPKPASPSAAWYREYNACLPIGPDNGWTRDYTNRFCIADANSRVGR